MRNDLRIIAALSLMLISTTQLAQAEESDRGTASSISAPQKATRHKARQEPVSAPVAQAKESQKPVDVTPSFASKIGDVWSRVKDVFYWIGIIIAVIFAFKSLQHTLGGAILGGLSIGTIGYVLANDFGEWGVIGAIIGAIGGAIGYIFETFNGGSGRQVVVGSGNYGADQSGFNPANGLPMNGGLDIHGNPYGSAGVNPANGVPMASGHVDVQGNVYGTNHY